MPRTTITPANLPVATTSASVLNNLVAGDVANGNQYRQTGDGQEILVARNSGASPYTVTIASVADQQGRTGDLVDTLAAGDVRFYRLPQAGWQQTTGFVNVNVQNVAVLLGVLRLT